MKSTVTMPLPLTLTQPVELGSTLEAAAYLEFAGTSYNAETQLLENAEGLPQFHASRCTSSHVSSTNHNYGIAVDVDLAIDDNDIL